MTTQTPSPVHYANGVVDMQKHDGRYWPMSAIAQADKLLPSWQDRQALRLRGAAAGWMYAWIGARAAAAGVQRVSVLRPEGIEPVFPGPIDGASEESGLQIVRNGSRIFVSVAFSRDGNASALAARVAPHIQRGDEVLVTGRGPVELYAFLGFVAARAGARSMGCITPPEGMASVAVFGSHVGITAELDAWTRAQLPRGEGATYGVIGFPNSGKSVISKLIAASLRKDHVRAIPAINAWTFDADPASPTPDWFLSMLSTGDEIEAKRVRKEHKVDWNDALQEQITARLRHSMPFFDRVIVDLPGGDCRMTPPDLIPAGREALFELVQKFVVINRPDLDSGRQWIEMLDRHGLAQRVHAVIDSIDPASPLELKVHSDGKILRGEARGLDRQAVEALVSHASMPVELIRSLRWLVGIV